MHLLIVLCLVRDIVRAIITLHCQGYWCSGLKGKHICIYKMEKCTDAKIWSFCFAGMNLAKKKKCFDLYSQYKLLCS